MGLNLCVGLLKTLQLTNFQQFHVVLSGLLQLQNLDDRLMIGQKDQTGCVLLLVASFLSVEPISWNVGSMPAGCCAAIDSADIVVGSSAISTGSAGMQFNIATGM